MAKLVWNDSKSIQLAKDGAFEGLIAFGEILLDASQAIAPVDEGTLETSAQLSSDKALMKAVVSYDTEYAARQHEDPDYTHQAGKQWKYLENPANELGQSLLGALVGQGIKDRLA